MNVVEMQEWKLSDLTGKQVQVYAYCRGYYPRDTMYALWKMMEDEKATPLVFPAHEAKKPEMLYEVRGDLTAFVKYFENCILMISQHIENNEIMGMIWFNDIIPGERAFGSVFCRRRYWGESAREASRICLDYAFRKLGFKTIWASTPWDIAAKHARSLGFKDASKIYGVGSNNGAELDVNILKLTMEDFYGRHR